jgi:hypothetical protein
VNWVIASAEQLFFFPALAPDDLAAAYHTSKCLQQHAPVSKQVLSPWLDGAINLAGTVAETCQTRLSLLDKPVSWASKKPSNCRLTVRWNAWCSGIGSSG